MAKAIIELKEPVNKIEFYLNQYELKALEGKFIHEGKWLTTPTAWIYCSECGLEPPNETNYKSDFCPNCGARMSK